MVIYAYTGWYNSPGHKENMFNGSFKKTYVWCIEVLEGDTLGYRYYWGQAFN